jgi:hypothetical protein
VAKDELADIRALASEDATKTALRKALIALDKAKASKEELVAAVYQAAKDAACAVSPLPVPAPPKDKRKADPEAAICLLADWQYGKVTPGPYNSQICAERLRKYAAKVVRLIELQRTHHPVTEAHILLLGDLLEGELIFPGQAHRIDASLYRQLFDGADVLAQLVRTIVASVERVKVVGCIGNHGAIGGKGRREMHPESNADAMMYNIARLSCQDPRIDWQETLVTDERAWYATDDIMGKRWLIFHGDQIKGASLGYPWYGYGKKLLGYYSAVQQFDYSASGHWHVPVRMTLNSITHWGAGSTESGNTYAQEYMASGSQQPSQWLLFQGEHGVTSEYLVRL